MLLLEELLTPLATLLHLPVGITIFAALMLLGAVGHYTIYHVVRRLTTAADHTDTRWTTSSPMPFFRQFNGHGLGLLSISPFSVLDGIREGSCAIGWRYLFCLAGAHRLSQV